MALGANRGRNDDKMRLRDEVVQGQPVNKPIPTHHHRQPVYNDDLEKEDEFDFADHRPVRGSGRQVRDFDRDCGDFRLKVDIPYFNGNLNIEDFINWLVDIDKFFDYMEVLEENIVKLVACRLKRGVSAWWKRLHNRRTREGKQSVRT